VKCRADDDRRLFYSCSFRGKESSTVRVETLIGLVKGLLFPRRPKIDAEEKLVKTGEEKACGSVSLNKPAVPLIVLLEGFLVSKGLRSKRRATPTISSKDA
jgi:hypothetical protein